MIHRSKANPPSSEKLFSTRHWQFAALIFLTLGYADATATEPADQTLAGVESQRILEKAQRYLKEKPKTITADLCERSAGGPHDFYSEGDYWWPDPSNPDGPYIRRDGESNPNAFLAHRKSMLRLAEVTATLASAYRLTGESKFAAATLAHLRAWFVDEDTRMNPNLLYGQAIQGRHTGRSIGIIDTLHLIEVARAAKVIENNENVDYQIIKSVKDWFAEYLNWLNTHPYGLKEKQHPNNHGVCWSLQAAVFADLVGDNEQLEWVREEFKSNYLRVMMDKKGGFPAELKRTKPYGYSLFVLDAMSGIAQVASTKDDNLWSFELPDGRGMRLAMQFMFPYIKDKSSWPYAEDIQYWQHWPVRHSSLLFAGLAYANEDYLQQWQQLEPDPKTFEVIRNLPIRHPLLWVEEQNVPIP